MLTARLNVIARSAITYLTIATTLVVVVAGELPQEWQSGAARVVAALGGAVAMIRRVTPVEKADRGLLEPEPPPPPAGDEVLAWHPPEA